MHVVIHVAACDHGRTEPRFRLVYEYALLLVSFHYFSIPKKYNSYPFTVSEGDRVSKHSWSTFMSFSDQNVYAFKQKVLKIPCNSK